MNDLGYLSPLMSIWDNICVIKIYPFITKNIQK